MIDSRQHADRVSRVRKATEQRALGPTSFELPPPEHGDFGDCIAFFVISCLYCSINSFSSRRSSKTLLGGSRRLLSEGSFAALGRECLDHRRVALELLCRNVLHAYVLRLLVNGTIFPSSSREVLRSRNFENEDHSPCPRVGDWRVPNRAEGDVAREARNAPLERSRLLDGWLDLLV